MAMLYRQNMPSTSISSAMASLRSTTETTKSSGSLDVYIDCKNLAFLMEAKWASDVLVAPFFLKSKTQSLKTHRGPIEGHGYFASCFFAFGSFTYYIT